jgi:rare lipoprotein A
MTQKTSAARVVRRSVSIALASGLILSVAACTPTGEFVLGSRDAASDGPAPIGAAPASERDVEAPDVFDVTGEGLWDGRPSLGGVWVAHPDAVDPERVIIRNTETGRFVIGALFRRERNNPGPPIQVSSEAAAALAILAGNPTDLQVTALRREEPAPEDTPEAAVSAEAPEVAADTSDLVAETRVQPAEGEAPDPGASAPVAAMAEAPAPTGGGFLAALNRVFRAAPDAAPSPEPTATPEPAPVEPRNMTADDVASGIRTAAFATTELEAVRPVPAVAAAASAAIAESEAADPALAVQATALPPLPASARVPAPARTPQTSPDTPLSRAFVQIGIFSVQENANNTGQALRSAGLVPTIYDQTSNDRRFWRVVVGPAQTSADRAAILETVQGLGFEDAYFVRR